MKLFSVKTAFVTTSVLAATSFANVSLAHTLNGSLGSGASATDYYLVTCAAQGTENTARLEVKVKDTAPVAAPLLSVSVARSKLAASATDNGTDGDTAFSPLIKVNGGNGSYIVLVHKSGSGSETYTLDYHCYGTAGTHTPTSISTQQNQ